jgi:hypothetical protein
MSNKWGWMAARTVRPERFQEGRVWFICARCDASPVRSGSDRSAPRRPLAPLVRDPGHRDPTADPSPRPLANDVVAAQPPPCRPGAPRPGRGRARSSSPAVVRRAPRRCGSPCADPPRRPGGRARAWRSRARRSRRRAPTVRPGPRTRRSRGRNTGATSSNPPCSSRIGARCTVVIAMLNRSPISPASALASSLSSSASFSRSAGPGADRHGPPVRLIESDWSHRTRAQPSSGSAT